MADKRDEPRRPPIVLTVGHSNHAPDAFLNLLAHASVTSIVDVRSQPYSKYASHFNRATLEGLLAAAGVTYRFEPALGGRPEDPSMYDEAGHVLYARVAASPPFAQAIAMLEDLDADVVALMCGEEDPTDCHRRLLIGRVLEDKGVAVSHLRGDGSVQPEEELSDTGFSQPGLFEEEEVPTWRSIRSVSPSGPRRTSSEA